MWKNNKFTRQQRISRTLMQLCSSLALTNFYEDSILRLFLGLIHKSLSRTKCRRTLEQFKKVSFTILRESKMLINIIFLLLFLLWASLCQFIGFEALFSWKSRKPPFQPNFMYVRTFSNFTGSAESGFCTRLVLELYSFQLFSQQYSISPKITNSRTPAFWCLTVNPSVSIFYLQWGDSDSPLPIVFAVIKTVKHLIIHFWFLFYGWCCVCECVCRKVVSPHSGRTTN